MGAFRLGERKAFASEKRYLPQLLGEVGRNSSHVASQTQLSRHFMGCNTDRPIIIATLWHRYIFLVGPPILLQAIRGPTSA